MFSNSCLNSSYLPLKQSSIHSHPNLLCAPQRNLVGEQSVQATRVGYQFAHVAHSIVLSFTLFKSLQPLQDVHADCWGCANG